VKSHTLNAALRAYVEQAADRLAEDTALGAEVPFELVEEGGSRRTPLYCYRPLVDEFLRERLGVLGALDAHAPAVRALGAHADALGRYLAARGRRNLPDPDQRARAALPVLLERVFADTTEFAFDPDRFARAYAELEDLLFAGRTDATVVAAVLGLDIASDEVVLGEGLVLRRAEAMDGGPPDAGEDADVLAVFRAEVREDAPDPFVQAGRRFRRLLTALRLYDDGAVALAPVAWTRVDEGPWRAVGLGTAGAAHGVTLIDAEDEDELRAFCNLVARRTPRSGDLAWALGRYEMACERHLRGESLTDVLLALRALLEPEGPQSGRLPGRLAALCAAPDQHVNLAERAAHAIALERSVIAGTAPRSEAVDALFDELTGHLRALLRDVLCGHLDGDLRGLADRLIEQGAPVTS
jgi:hypothetical protein